MKKEFIEADRALKKNGYVQVRAKGSHYIYSNGVQSVALNIKLNRMVMARLLKECGIRL